MKAQYHITATHSICKRISRTANAGPSPEQTGAVLETWLLVERLPEDRLKGLQLMVSAASDKLSHHLDNQVHSTDNPVESNVL